MSWIDNIRIGDTVRIDPYWNATTPNYLRINPSPKVTGVLRGSKCETGTLIQVKNKSGGDIWLCAGWFIDPEVEN